MLATAKGRSGTSGIVYTKLISKRSCFVYFEKRRLIIDGSGAKPKSHEIIGLTRYSKSSNAGLNFDILWLHIFFKDVRLGHFKGLGLFFSYGPLCFPLSLWHKCSLSTLYLLITHHQREFGVGQPVFFSFRICLGIRWMSLRRRPHRKRLKPEHGHGGWSQGVKVS